MLRAWVLRKEGAGPPADRRRGEGFCVGRLLDSKVLPAHISHQQWLALQVRGTLKP